MTRGRKPHTAEQRATAKLTAKAKIKNISLDADLVDALNAAADKLGTEFGFRPTLSQTVRHMIKRLGE